MKMNNKKMKKLKENVIFQTSFARDQLECNMSEIIEILNYPNTFQKKIK